MAAFIEFNDGPVRRLIQGRSKDLGGFQVRRLLPVAGQQMVGPWIFFDHMGPAQFAAGDGIKVRPHPHINLATVTYLFSGEMLHRDSLGSEQVIQPGAINLMVAGSGIVHSERERPNRMSCTACSYGSHCPLRWRKSPRRFTILMQRKFLPCAAAMCRCAC